MPNINYDKFYPAQANVQLPLKQIGWTLKIREHLTLAKAGDRERESRLCNRLGSLRRSSPSFDELTEHLKDVVKEAVTFLRSQGRKVDFKHSDPACWITMRDGRPRW
jgi:hypothetical protein